MVFIAGLSELGCYHPRAIALSRLLAEKGLLVRHLVMPNDVSNTKEVMTFLADKISEDTYVNVMDQYHPCGKATLDPAINRRLTRKEYVEAIRLTREAGLHRLDSRR